MAADDAKETKPKGKASLIAWLGALVALTFVCGGLGAGFGLYLSSQVTMAGKETKPEAEAVVSHHITNSNVRDLPPVITNLDQTSDTWIRLQAAIVFDSAMVEKPDVLATQVASDILGFIQTLSVAQITGSSGLMHLREDLNDRAIIRSEGRVHELVIESLVLQ